MVASQLRRLPLLSPYGLANRVEQSACILGRISGEGLSPDQIGV